MRMVRQSLTALTLNRARSLMAAGLTAMIISAGTGISLPAHSQQSPTELRMGIDTSLRKDAIRAVETGLQWLSAHQDSAGFWTTPYYPAVTGLVVQAYLSAPQSLQSGYSDLIHQSLEFIISCTQPDGRIYIPAEQARGGGLPTYNTAVCLQALAAAEDPKHVHILEKTREALIADQHLGSDPFYGGMGYDAQHDRAYADLSNTYFAMEALKVTEYLTADKPNAAKLDVDAAIEFISKIQNLPGSNPQPWAQNATADDYGGFVYHPDQSQAGEDTTASGGRRLRSYGSMTYAGLLSFIYADLDRNDKRVLAAIDWMRHHYTVDENPGLGADGLFYNYHTMAKALVVHGEEPFKLNDGRLVNWRDDLAQKLVSMQKIDPEEMVGGFWVNEASSRWWENDPVLCTTYAVLVLNIILR